MNRRLPGIDLELSPICLGTGGFGGSIDRQTSFAMLDRFVGLGGNALDTAHVYSNWIPGEKSRSEKTIGLWLQSRQNRQNVIIGTKGAHPNLETMHQPRLSRAEIQSDLEESLGHLQTDWIDLYWLHRDDPTRPVEDILETLNSQVAAGKIRCFGASNWTLERLRLAQEYAATNGIRGFVADQVLWNAAVIDANAIPDQTTVVMDRALERYHRSTGLAAMPYSAQANGLFQRLLTGTLEQMSPVLRAQYPLAANLERLKVIQKIRQATNLTVTQVVLGFLISQPFVTIPIVGPRTLEQLEDSLSALEVHLSPEQLAAFA